MCAVNEELRPRGGHIDGMCVAYKLVCQGKICHLNTGQERALSQLPCR